MDAQTLHSRRTLLKGAPVAVAAAMLPATAVSAYSVPVEPGTPTEYADHPWVKARSLAKALSQELDKVKGWEGNGGWRAHVGPGSESIPIHYEAIGWRAPLEEQDYHLARFIDAAKAIDPGRGGWSVSRNVETGAVFRLVRHGFDAVADAIATHSAARQQSDRCADALERASLRYDQMTGPDFRVQVCVGRLISSLDKDRPIYAVTHGAIDVHYDRQIAARCGIPGRETELGLIESRRAAKHVELRKLKRRARYLREKSGLTAAWNNMNAARRNEERAAVAVLLATPADNLSDAAKRRHMRRYEIFQSDWWEGADLMGALKAVLGIEG